VHFVIQAPNLAQMYINMLQTFSDIGPLEILSLCPSYWISKWPPFEVYILPLPLGLMQELTWFWCLNVCFGGKESNGTDFNLILFITVGYIIVFGNYLGKYWIQHNTLKRMIVLNVKCV